MDATHIHLILTHFPIIGTIIGIGILTYGQFSKNDSIKKVALSTFIIMSLLTIPVFLTGEEAEESVEHLAGVSENIIEEHEELAEKAIWLMYFFTSSSLIPMPLSKTVMVFFFLSTLTSMVISPRSPLTSPSDESAFNFWVASTAFDINSLRNIS